MYRVLLLVVLLILHESLYPWQFAAPPLRTSPVEVLLHSWPPAPMDRYFLRDVAANLALYIPLGLVGYLALRENAGRRLASAGSLLLALLLSSSVEIVQLFVPWRTCSLFDVVLDVVGAALGLGLAVRFEDRLQAMGSAGGPVIGPVVSGATVLLSGWVGYQLFPFFPDLSTTHLAGKLFLLRSADSWSILRTFMSCCEWLAVGRLVESTFPPGRSRTAFRTLLLLLPAKLFVAGRTVTGSELAGAAFALLPWQRFRSREAGRGYLLACLFTLALTLEGLMPTQTQKEAILLRGSAVHAAAMADWQYEPAVLFERSFALGAILWLFWQVGRRSVSAAAHSCRNMS